jgi:hypothetical protein
MTVAGLDCISTYTTHTLGTMVESNTSVSFRSFVHTLEIAKLNGPVQDLLDADSGEEWIYGQSDVGLYEG